MISPMWAFQTQIAREVMSLSSATVLLCPTPNFWGNRDGKTGTNNPHGVIYIGSRVSEFRRAFRPFGITVTVDQDTDGG